VITHTKSNEAYSINNTHREPSARQQNTLISMISKNAQPLYKKKLNAKQKPLICFKIGARLEIIFLDALRRTHRLLLYIFLFLF
jgi:hypothetical protein